MLKSRRLKVLLLEGLADLFSELNEETGQSSRLSLIRSPLKLDSLPKLRPDMFDVVVLDATAPQNNGNPDASVAVRYISPRIPVVAITRERSRFSRDGVIEFLHADDVSSSSLEETICSATKRQQILDEWNASAGALLLTDFLRSVLDTMSEGVAILDAEGTILFANETWKNFSGYGETIFSGDTGTNYVAICERAASSGDTDIARFAAGLQLALRGDVASFEQDVHIAAGVERWFSSRISVAVQGDSRKVIVAHNDITSLKHIETTLHRRDEELRTMFHYNFMPQWIYDTSTLRILDVNNAAVIHYGYSRTEFLTMRLTDLLPDDVIDVHRVSVEEPKDSEPFVWKHKTKNGGIMSVEVSTRDIEFENRRARVVTVNDITKVRLAEEALHETRRRYIRLDEEHLTGNFTSTPSGELLACNSAFAKMFGYNSVEEALMTNAVDFYASKEDRKRFLQLMRENGKLDRFEARLQRKDGSTFYVVENVVGSFDHQGNLTEITGFMFDITEQKNLEEQIRQSRTVNGMSILASGIAEDFTRILEVIQENISAMQEAGADIGTSVDRVAAIQESLQRGSRLVHQLNAFAGKGVEPAPPKHTTPEQMFSGTVLVVEDEPMLLDLIVSVLEERGLRVHSARDGETAHDVFRNNYKSVDVIITDMGLPKRSGLEFFRKAKEMNHAVRGIMMSGYLEADERDSIMNSGFDLILDKPFETSEVVKALQNIMESVVTQKG